MSEKEALRKVLKAKRDAIPEARRKEAQSKVMSELYPLLAPYPYVLSFASFRSEIDLWTLNRRLCEEQRLLLPRVEERQIAAYQIEDLDTLIPSKIGIMEPNPQISKMFPKQNIQCALIPALGFDRDKHRLGYGQGHFDTFLLHLKNCMSIGVGFKEQLLSASLSIEQHDQVLQRVILV
jgi:5-formyltetrahydrofolate cyclo-ligase